MLTAAIQVNLGLLAKNSVEKWTVDTDCHRCTYGVSLKQIIKIKLPRQEGKTIMPTNGSLTGAYRANDVSKAPIPRVLGEHNCLQ